MNIDNIKKIISSNAPDFAKESMIMTELSKDKQVIPKILSLLEEERELNKELILDTNLELSRALVALEDKQLGKKKGLMEISFVTEEIKKHYLKWQNSIRCCFKMKDLP
jgi:hypothetical protein